MKANPKATVPRKHFTSPVTTSTPTEAINPKDLVSSGSVMISFTNDHSEEIDDLAHFLALQ